MNHHDNNLIELFDKTQILGAAVHEAVAQAIERHRRLGESIVVCRDGQVVVVPPEEIPPYQGNSTAHDAAPLKP